MALLDNPLPCPEADNEDRRQPRGYQAKPVSTFQNVECVMGPSQDDCRKADQDR
jgi:hypothetical protein